MLLATLYGGLVCLLSPDGCFPRGTVEARVAPALDVAVRQTPAAAVDETGKSGILGRERGREDTAAELETASEPGAAGTKSGGTRSERLRAEHAAR